MIRSRHENRKPSAPNFPKIPTLQHRCNKVAFRIVADEGVITTTRGSVVRVGDCPNWSQFVFSQKSFSELDGTMSITTSFWKSGYG
jgi:hypothetical protein